MDIKPSQSSRRFRSVGIVALALLGVFAVVATACGKSSSSENSSGSTLKAAWIYVGPINDGGWSQAHNAGREFVANALGSKIQTTYKENVPEGPEVAQVINDLIKGRQFDHLRNLLWLQGRHAGCGSGQPKGEVRNGDR